MCQGSAGKCRKDAGKMQEGAGKRQENAGQAMVKCMKMQKPRRYPPASCGG